MISSCLSLSNFSNSVTYFANGFSHFRVFEWDQIGIRQAHDGGASGLRKRAPVGEIGINELGVPGKIVVDGMVGVGVIFAAIANVQCRNAGMVEERRVVGAVSERADCQFSTFTNLAAFFLVLGICDAGEASPLPYRNIFFRIFDFANHVVDEFFKVVRSGSTKKSTAIAVGVDVGDCMLLEVVAVRFHPFG